MRNISAKTTVPIFAPNGTPLPAAEVLCLRIKDFPRLLGVIDDEDVAAEVYCGKPRGWADTLSDESIVAICQEGEKLNESFFVPWVQRRAARVAKVSGRPLSPEPLMSGLQSAPSVPA